jgi:hypothetical protein
MQNRAKLLKNRPFAVPRLAWRISLAMLGCLLMAPSLVHAHAGMAGSELGPPLVTSGVLGFVCYWLVMLWPSTKKKADPAVGSGVQNQSVTRTGHPSHKNSARMKRVPRLRKIERSDQVVNNMNSGRKATDV